MPVTLEVREQFDAKVWQTAEPRGVGWAGLLTWEVTQAPVDGGIPDEVARVFAAALCETGRVVYAGDGDAQARRTWQRNTETMFIADSVEEVLPAFNSGMHDWSMNAQWLVIMDAAADPGAVLDAGKKLYEDWTLPSGWPSGVKMIVQAAVDGDGAACYCADQSIKRSFLVSLRRHAERAGMELRVFREGAR